VSFGAKQFIEWEAGSDPNVTMVRPTDASWRGPKGESPMLSRVVCTILGLIGGVAGGVLGYYLFSWIYHQGFYALIVLGAGIGLGCGLLSRNRPLIRGAICGLAALVLGLYTEWKFAPFVADDRFSYLVSHFYELKPIMLHMISIGGIVSFWLGRDAAFGSVPKEKPSRLEHAPSDLE
jgi:hypothetical protein